MHTRSVNGTEAHSEAVGTGPQPTVFIHGLMRANASRQAQREAFSTPARRQPRGGARPLVAGLALSILAACASTPAGVAGYDAFKADAMPRAVIGSRDAALAAQCFEDQAKFLPLSTFSRDPATMAFTYRLRITDLWFEEVRIAPEGLGSRAEWRVASNLDAKWLGQFERDRAEPLRQCLGA